MNFFKNIIINRKIYLLVIFTLLIIILTGTYARWLWVSNELSRTAVSFSVIPGVSCSADGGGSITADEVSLVPVSCTNSEHVIRKIITTNVDLGEFEAVSLNMWLNVDSLGSYLVNNSDFKYTISKNDSCTNGIVTRGNFGNVSVGSSIPILNKRIYTPSFETETYYLYMWLDKSETTIPPDDVGSRTMSLSLGGTCNSTDLIIYPEKPVLDDAGMIPVIISNDGTVTTISADDEVWYNYEEKKWANAVLVRENATSSVDGSKSRQYYKDNIGVDVLEYDILAYYVWIPRYKYKIWTLSASSSGNERLIDIVFEESDSEISNGTQIDEWITHPAFIFGSEKIAGFWVGKFELTGNATLPTIKPNVASLKNQNVSLQFTTNLKFAGGTLNSSTGLVTFNGNNTYGLTNNTDSHMMKNSEWGALAYLSHSKYGIEGEVRLNNNSGYVTGCGATDKNGASDSNCQNAYGSLSNGMYLQSTTGNITGVFDASGGSFEYVMGRFQNPTVDNAGFSKYPAQKYYDVYSNTLFVGDNSTNMGLCGIASCGGHALHETFNWYDDFPYFVSANVPWFVRGGGYYGAGSSSGIFASGYNTGNRVASYSSRTVFVVTNLE